MEVGTGEAVTSLLDAKGVPGIVERTLVRPPSSQLGPVDGTLRAQIIAASPMRGKYEARVNRESAHEILTRRAAEAAEQAAAAEEDDGLNHARRYDGGRSRQAEPAEPRSRSRQSSGGGFGDALATAVVKELKGTTGRRIVRGIFGTIFRSR
jgi:hypothetical protein